MSDTEKKERKTTKIIEQVKQKVEKKKPIFDLKFFQSGCDLLDLALGGGFIVGRPVNFIGNNSVCKTLLASETVIYNKYKDKDHFKFYYDDAEHGNNFDATPMYNIELIDQNDVGSTTLEEFMWKIDKKMTGLQKDDSMIYVLDSFDALSCEAEKKKIKVQMSTLKKKFEEGKVKEKEAGDYGTSKAKEIGKFFRNNVDKMAEKNCTLIMISQIRDNIGAMYSDPYNRSGGKPLDFYPHQIVGLKLVDKKLKLKREVGITILAFIKKNKAGKPFRKVFIDILFDYGIDNVSTNLTFLYDLRDIATVKGELKDKKMKWDENDNDEEEKSLVDMIKFIEKNNLEDELKQRVIEKWNAIEESIAPKRKSKYA